MTKQETITKLQELSLRLATLKGLPQNGDEVNMFTALNLQSAERHHSSFFAGLLAPGNAHHLGDAAIKKFLYYLWDDTVRKETLSDRPGTVKSRPNTEILRSVAQDRQSLIDLAQGNINVKTEVFTNNNGKGKRAGFIDILVEIAEKDEEKSSAIMKTVIVIENKTGTETHSDQLCKYEEYIDATYPDCKKIFVLLSPHGSVPINRGGDEQYNDRYCIFDYSEERGVCKILEELLAELDTPEMKASITPKQKRKIKMILEDYKIMVEKNILANDPEIRKEIKKLYDKFSDILPLIMNYYDNLSDLLDHAVTRFTTELPGFEVISRNDNSINFCTSKLRSYYTSKNQPITPSNVYRIATNDNNLVGYFIMARVFPKQQGDPAFSGTIEKWERRGEKIQGQFELEIDAILTEFRNRILYFESKI